MEPAPIQGGAIRPLDRPCHAVARLLVRLLAVTGFAFAGWLALSTVDGPAHAEARDHVAGQLQPWHRAGSLDVRQVGDRAVGSLRPWRDDDALGEPAGDLRPWQRADALVEREIGDRPAGHLRDWRQGVSDVRGRVREIGDQPVRYLKERRQDVFAGKDRVVRRVQELTTGAGVPRVRIDDVRHTPLVSDVAGDAENPPSDVGDAPEPRPRERFAHGYGTAPSAGAAAARAGLGAVVRPEAFAGGVDARDTGRCPGCQSDRHGPLLPAGQDEPRKGTGGHQLSPVADLMANGRYPAVPAAVDARTFHRTALTDVSAPGGPSVVPD